jgi:hypothetical protein
MRVEHGKHFGTDEYKNREAVIYYNQKHEWFEVDFYDGSEIVETRKMVTESREWGRTIHSERYADDAAENWCLGYIP